MDAVMCCSTSSWVHMSSSDKSGISCMWFLSCLPNRSLFSLTWVKMRTSTFQWSLSSSRWQWVPAWEVSPYTTSSFGRTDGKKPALKLICFVFVVFFFCLADSMGKIGVYLRRLMLIPSPPHPHRHTHTHPIPHPAVIPACKQMHTFFFLIKFNKSPL